MTIHPFVAGFLVFAPGFITCLLHYQFAREQGEQEWDRGERDQAIRRIKRAERRSTIGLIVTLFLTAAVVLLAYVFLPAAPPEPPPPVFHFKLAA